MKSPSILRYRALRHARRSHLRGPQYRSIELGNLCFGSSRGLFPVERGEWQEAFCRMLEDAGFDFYGHYGYTPDGKRRDDAPHMDCVKKWPNKRRDFGFENGTFVIRPYYWGGNSRAARRPNFVFKPTGFQIKWYKYPLRDAYANRDLSLDEFKAMLAACAASIGLSNLASPSPDGRTEFDCSHSSCGEGLQPEAHLLSSACCLSTSAPNLIDPKRL